MKPLTPYTSPGSVASTGATAGATTELTPPSAVPRAEAEADAVMVPCTAFSGSIIEISSIASAVPVSVVGSLVSAPYWQSSMVAAHASLPAGQSSHPAAVPTRAGSDVEMTVKIEVTKAEGLSGTSTLRGQLAGVEWTGGFPSSTGVHSVTVRLAGATTRLAAHRGDISWQAEVPRCGTHPVGRTRVEIYRISEDIRPTYLTAGRPAEALRFLYDRAGVSGVDVAPPSGVIEATARVTSFLHSSHGMTYDIHKGGTGFLTSVTPRSYAFEIKKYIEKNGNNTGGSENGAAIGNMLNCYDQASAVQVFSGIIGINGRKRYVDPFGFIKATNLVGGARTNSPFHGGLHLPSQGVSIPVSPAIVPQSDPRRTAFGNHEFYVNAETDKIFDACAEPHLGTEDYDEYLAASVDTDMDWIAYSGGRVNTGATLTDWRGQWRYWDDALEIVAIR